MNSLHVSFRHFATLLFSSLLLCSVLNLTSCRGGADSKSLTTNIRLAAEPAGLNPLLSTDAITMQITGHLFQSLLDFDPQTLVEEPVLAKTKALVTPIDTGMYKGLVRLQYEIREEAKWDNGSPVTGEDFLFTVKAIRTPQVKANAARAYTEHIREILVNAANPKQFDVIVTPYILSESSCNGMPILPSYNYDPKNILKGYTLEQLSNLKGVEALQKDTILNSFANAFQSVEKLRSPTSIAGSGPYRALSWESDQKIVIVRKENWWAANKAGQLFAAAPEQLVYHIVKDNQAALNMLKEGSVDLVSRVQPQVFVQMREDLALKKSLQFVEAPTLEVSYLGLNMKSTILKDVRVRMALAHLTDVDGIIKNIYRGLAKPALGPIHPSRTYYNSAMLPMAFNPQLADSLLTAAGWKDSDGNGIREQMLGGKKTELRLRFCMASANEVAKNIGLFVQEQAKKSGVAIALEPIETERYREILSKRDFDIFAASMATDLAPYEPKQYWHTQSDTPDGSNRFGFGDKNSDALIDSLRTSLNPAERDAGYLKFQSLVYAAQPAIFLCTPLERIVANKDLEITTSVKRPGFFEAALVKK